MVEKNVGGIDRVVRGALGALLVAVAVDAVIDERRAFAAVVGTVGAGLLFNAATRYCGGNALLGVDTRPSGTETSPESSSD